jgi:hypothetical protein
MGCVFVKMTKESEEIKDAFGVRRSAFGVP